MSSYRFDAARSRTRDRMSQNRTPSSPITNSIKGLGIASASQSSKPQTATDSPARASRSLSFSVAEETRSIAGPTRPKPTKTPSSNDVRLSLLPRPSSHLQTNISPRTSQQSVKPERQMPVEDEPRNILRRKAATIGQKQNDQTTEAKKPRRLRVVIPNTSRPGHFNDVTPRMPWAPPKMAKNESTPSILRDQTSSKDTEEPTLEGPKELASLRTVVDTQSLLPQTPMLPSAGTPSTRYSLSPGIWSRGSTPTSVSSCSPGIPYSSKFGYRSRQVTPSETKLPVHSPLMQQSTSQGTIDQVSIGSPNLRKGSESNISLGGPKPEEQQRSPKAADFPKPPGPPRSALPRRISVYSSSPGKLNTDERTSRKEEENAPKTIGSPTTRRSRNSGPIPPRPSREGTDELHPEPSPVVRSHLPRKTASIHKRRQSTDDTLPASKQSTSSLDKSSTDSLHSRRPSRTSLSTTSRVMPPKLSHTSSKDRQENPNTKSPVTPTSAIRRFGFFRKNKSETGARISESSRMPRKGPAAGTGHEGYGKYAHGGRKSSGSSNNGAKTRSTSTHNASKSASGSKGNGKGQPGPEIDDFFLNRLEPVVINGGGGVDGPSLSRTQSEQSRSGCSTASSTVKQDKGRSSESLTSSSGMSQLGEKLFGHRRASQGNEQKRSNKVKSKGLRSFFQRSHSKQRKEPASEAPTTSVSELRARTAPTTSARPFAHYAFVDTEPDSLEDIIRRVDDSPPTEPEDEEPRSSVELSAALNVQKSRQSALLPSPPKMQSEFCTGRQSTPKVYMHRNASSFGPVNEEKPAPQRRSRLASIGRIPQVISRRDRQHKPDSNSFSRPFSAIESPSSAAPVEEPQISVQVPASASTTDMGESPTELSSLGFDLTQPFRASVLDFIAGPYSKNEFLKFSPDNNPPHSSNDSDKLAAVTAAIPQPGSELGDDEVWNEYDDLIDHILSPMTPKMMEPGSGMSDEKLESAALASETLQAEIEACRDLSGFSVLAGSPRNRSSRASDQSVRLRRSTIAPALRSSYAPSSQPSYDDLNVGKSDNQDKETTEEDDILVLPSVEMESQPSLLPSPLVTSQSFEACRQRNTILFDIAERDREGPTAQTNIRSGSLMTSRWLSFGRILFSPAHNHVKSGECERILVIDGLGNDDWSFYCAVNYSNTGVYNLHVGPEPAASSHPAMSQPPPNYHTVYHPSLADRFPFPMGYFAVTVLRFPAACPEHIQNNIASECKRVLRPGGYMEMSILDVDMVNMGIHTRKAVRGLKERTYLADPSISLKPASDNIQRLLGRHGFDNLHRCMVRIPVAGVITRSSASSSSTTSSSSLHPSMSLPAATKSAPSFGDGLKGPTPNTTTTTANHYHDNTYIKSPANDTNLSLSDLLSDPAPSPSNDESIRKIVAKVGRWWYTRCYEIPVLPDGDVDLRIWSDKRVLRECQKRGTGFRLLIAHAQKPSEVNRRTASV